MEIRVPITYMAIAAMLLALPEFLDIASTTVVATGPAMVSESVEGAKNFSDLTNNMQTSMSQIAPIIGYMCYLMGIMFGMKAIFAFKAHAEYYGGVEIHASNEKKIKNPVQQSAKVNLNKEIKIDTVKKTESVKDMFKKEKLYEYDFEDKELSELGVHVQNKVKYLKGHNFLQKDMEALLMVENTEKEYLKSIHQSYIEIPFAKRGDKKIENSPYNLTMRQLNVLLQGLDDIENKIVQSNIMDQKANERFLKQKVASM
jgi:hypothetical protein